MASTLANCRACGQPVLVGSRCCPHCAVASPLAPQAVGLWIACVAVAASVATFAATQAHRAPYPTEARAVATWPEGDRVGAAGLRACPRIEDALSGKPTCPVLPAGTAVREVAQATLSDKPLACLAVEGRDACLWAMAP